MKRYLVECIGTFFLTFAVAMTANPFTIGLMLMAMIYMGGHVSGGHFNPAVSLSVYLRRKLSMNDLAYYAAAQTAGALGAVLLYQAVAATALQFPRYPQIWIGLMYEALSTFVLCVVVLEVVSCFRFKVPELGGLVIGLTLVGLSFLPAVLNPAIIIAGLLGTLIHTSETVLVGSELIRVAYPLIGAALAAVVFNYVDSQ